MSAKEPSQPFAKQGPELAQKKPRPRRDSGKDGRDAGAQALREFANSNSTMHAFMGGRQKSWMTPGMSPPTSALPSSSLTFPKKTNASPTTTAVPQPPLNPTGTPLQTWAAPTSVPPPSTNATIPQSKPVGIPKEESVLPSPAPSDDVVSPVVPASTEAQALGFDQDRNGRSESVDVGTIHPDPATGGGGEGTRNESPAALRPELIELDNNDDIVERQNAMQSASTSVPQPNHRGVLVQLGPPQNKRRRIDGGPAQGHGVTGLDPVNSLTPPSGALVLPSGLTPRPTISPSSAPPLKSYLPAIATHLRQSGGTLALGRTVDLFRIKLLEHACSNEDTMYLALHQMLCLETFRPGTLRTLQGFGAQQMTALGMVGGLLHQSQVSQHHLQWFATFPSPFEHLLRVSSLYQAAITDVHLFLTVVPAELRNLEIACIRRGHPPLTFEMMNNMKLKSKTLQRVVFKAIHQMLWPGPYDEWFERIEETYRQEQREYYEGLSRMNTSRPLPPIRVQERVRDIVLKYQKLRRDQLQSQGLQVQARPQAPNNLQPSTNAQPVTYHTFSAPVRSQPGTSQAPQPGASFTTFPIRPPMLRSNLHGQQSQPRLQVHIPPAHQFTPSASLSSSLTPHLPVANSSSHLSTPAHSPPSFTPRTQASAVTQPRVGQILQPSIHQTIPGTVPSDPYGTVRVGTGLRAIVPASPYTNPPSAAAVTPTPVVPLGLSQHTSTHISTHTSHHPAMPSQQQGPPRPSVFSAPALPAEFERLFAPSGPFPTLASVPPNPTFTALHQIHLRSPRLVPVDSDGKALTATRFYRLFKEFAVPPFLLAKDSRIVRRSFTLGSDVIGKLPQAYTYPSNEYLPAGSVREGTLMYRIRCCRLDPGSESCDESQWSVKELVWPPHVFFDLNGEVLDVRRKYHHGKDLAVEVSTSVREGPNTLTVVILRGDQPVIPFAFAVETIEFTTYDTIMRNCTQASPIPADLTLSQILESLAADPADDDLAFVNGHVTISVTDPFTSRIFNIPVRSTCCRHRDCFDLETFLQTRKTSPETPTESLQLVSKIDEWRCPLCGADARPEKLRIDEFMKQVRARLEELNQLDTKSIVVMQDGTWKANLGTHERRRTIPSSTTTSAPASTTVGEGTSGGTRGNLRQEAPAPTMDVGGGKERIVIELDD